MEESGAQLKYLNFYSLPSIIGVTKSRIMMSEMCSTRVRIRTRLNRLRIWSKGGFLCFLYCLVI